LTIDVRPLRIEKSNSSDSYGVLLFCGHNTKYRVEFETLPSRSSVWWGWRANDMLNTDRKFQRRAKKKKGFYKF